MFDFARKLDATSVEAAARIIRSPHHSRQLWKHLSKKKVSMISSDEYRTINDWLDLDKATYIYQSEKAACLVKDMQRNWDRLCIK